MADKTPAQQLLDAITALENTPDPTTRAKHAHALQEAMRASTARVRDITDTAVRELRDNGAPLAPVAKELGVSTARISQMANSKHGTKRPTRPAVIYAVRIADHGHAAPWVGDPTALPEGDYETGYIDLFNPPTRNRFAGHRLEVRYGRITDDELRPEVLAYTTINGRRMRVTATLQEALFAPH